LIIAEYVIFAALIRSMVVNGVNGVNGVELVANRWPTGGQPVANRLRRG
jgi:hypothetical protein